MVAIASRPVSSIRRRVAGLGRQGTSVDCSPSMALTLGDDGEQCRASEGDISEVDVDGSALSDVQVCHHLREIGFAGHVDVAADVHTGDEVGDEGCADCDAVALCR